MPFQWRCVVDGCPQASVNLAPTQTTNQNKEMLGLRGRKHVAEIPVQPDHEAEPCVVIGKRCKNVAPDSYLDVVTGYASMNDVSVREMQEGDEALHHADGQEPRHDGADRPLSRHQGRDRQPPNLQISTFVNGERRQFAKGPNDILIPQVSSDSLLAHACQTGGTLSRRSSNRSSGGTIGTRLWVHVRARWWERALKDGCKRADD